MKQHITILHDDVTYYDDVSNDIEALFKNVSMKKRKKWKMEYYDIPVCFDIETSSFYDHGEKAATMYIWMFSIDDNIIIGRTWDEFILLCDKLVSHFSLHPKFRRMIIYVQNLSFEFQWFCQRFTWQKVFALDNRIPLTALTDKGIEFRCSYRLSGYSLEKMGENLVKYKIPKMVGDLDYSKIRHSKTPLTDKEMGYCLNDVRVLSAYIREKIENENGITKIPLTKTGYVRNYCRQHIFTSEGKQFYYYKKLMQNMTIEPDEFILLKQAFQGGFTHANAFYVDKELKDVTSVDFNSSYPTSLCAFKYPMGKGELYHLKDWKDFEYQLKHYCCLFVVRFTNIESSILYENYISYSKCRQVQKPLLNNGRLVRADYLETTITELDFEIIKKCYTWEKINIVLLYRYKKAYLPTEFINCVLDFYETKTTLKDVEGKEVEYLQGKENLNSCYGMCCTDPAKPVITYLNDLQETEDVGWVEHDLILEEELEKHNKKNNRFLFYPWGVWCTAWSRWNLWMHGILKVKDDYIYSDTDSLKFLNAAAHKDFITEYNNWIGKQLLKAMRYHHIDPKRIIPKTCEGTPKPLGIWDFDGHYEKFKTLGAKRYMVKYSMDERNKPKNRGTLGVTVAGLNKKAGKKYLESFPDPFKVFTNDMNVPKGKAGKQTATYIDYATSGTVTDYMGNTAEYHELSSLHLEECGYDLSLASDFVKYILGINEVYL